jgi:hypothetical protein
MVDQQPPNSSLGITQPSTSAEPSTTTAVGRGDYTSGRVFQLRLKVLKVMVFLLLGEAPLLGVRARGQGGSGST